MRKIIFLLLVFFPFVSESQILNIEKSRLEKDTTKVFMLKTVAGMNIYNRSAAADDPVNLFGYNLDINALYYPGKHGYMFISKFDYLRINDSDFLNFGMVHGRVNFLRENTINFETFIQYSFDNFRGLDPRWIVGGSVRHSLISTDKISLLYGLGGMYEYEKWADPYQDRFVEVGFIKSSNYLSFRATINDFVDFNTVNYYQVGYDNNISAFRHRISNSTILNTKLNERFSISNSFEISYEDRPIVPITKVIYSFRTGLSFNF
ncbi:DUF481 domain-containing protein [Belliella kenyensis]|uniref:DUF481 domain-containing protein n=1 Tax=Belliella kenyensis TaxID=1472724 RepID=A0ABV8EQW6_9BACT|nr:DUF481 domain-containing protein [Belliella kenyensis]MCH7403792.1 DUF481 domain-containing protein [Belliella kenyensis]MDN3602424.1 DUF481 domain-containing protein [Belliella kenyensis]